jgi:hypothetical protein
MISVPNPCGEDISKMPRINAGLYCKSCEHLVTDFRNFSDQELLDFFKKKSEQKICGTFRSYQLSEKPALKRLYRFQSSFGKGVLFKAAGMFIVLLSFLSSCRHRTTGLPVTGGGSNCHHPEHQKKHLQGTRTLDYMEIDSAAMDSLIQPADTMKKENIRN